MEIPIDSISILLNVRTHADEEKDTALLMGSIQQQGLLEPIVVWEDPQNTGRYILDLGARRLTAVRKLGWKKLQVGKQVLINSEKYDRSQHITHLISENSGLFRKGNSYPEQALLVRNLVDSGLTPEEISTRLNFPITRVKLILKTEREIPNAIKAQIGFGPDSRKTGKLPSGIMATILKDRSMSNEDQEKLVKIALKQSLSQPQVTKIVSLHRAGASLEQALAISEEFVNKSVSIVLRANAVDTLLDQYPDMSFTKIVHSALQGRIRIPPSAFFNADWAIAVEQNKPKIPA